MKMRISYILFIAIIAGSCNKNSNCTQVTITQNGTICSTWGIILNGQAYPSEDIPADFRQEGLSVCVNYELYQDMRLCPCCGGTWARIKSISLRQ